MSTPKSVRLEDALEIRVDEYMEKNHLKFPQLINMALRKFISEEQTITLAPASNKEALEAAKKAFKKHKHTIDKLK
jgi:predicted transcriptional regulator